MVPDLFSNLAPKSLLTQEFDILNKLGFTRVLQIVMACYAELKKNHEKVVLIGFSVGAAYAMKVL